jgi:hypothetical protein
MLAACSLGGEMNEDEPYFSEIGGITPVYGQFTVGDFDSSKFYCKETGSIVLSSMAENELIVTYEQAAKLRDSLKRSELPDKSLEVTKSGLFVVILGQPGPAGAALSATLDLIDEEFGDGPKSA